MIEQLSNIAIVLKRTDYNTTQEMRETAQALLWVADQLEAELKKQKSEE